MTKPKDLIGNRIVITGAFGTLGKALCDYLKSLQPKFILIDLTSKVDEIFVQELIAVGAQVDIKCVDFEDKESRKKVFEEISRENPIIDVLVNNAAFVGNSKLTGWATQFEDQSMETWDRAINVNLSAPFELTQALTQSLFKSKKASVVNVGSIYGELGPDWRIYEGTSLGNPAAYSASKGGLLQLTKWLATTLAPKIRVNSVSPGGIRTNQEELFVRNYISRIPLGRMAEVEDIIPSIAFLASEDSKYITGENLRIDGGLNSW